MAKTRTVYSTQDDGAGTLRDALRVTASYTSEWIDAGALEDGDTIDFSDELEVDGVITIPLSSSLNCPQRTFTIDGGETWVENGVLKTRVILDGQSSTRVLLTASITSCYLSIQGITFKNGYVSSENGAGYYSRNNSNTNYIRNCVFDNCSAANGGAVLAYNESKNYFINCYFISCSATTNGGAFYCSAPSSNANSFNNCVFKNCSATNGGALYLRNSVATINNATFLNNTATNGGDVYIYAGLIVDTLTSPSGVYVAANAAFTLSQRVDVGSLFVGSGATVTFSGVDAVLAVTTTASVGAATFTAAEGATGYAAFPEKTDISAATFTGVKVATYSTSTPTISATITNRDASIEIKNAGSGYITEVEYADGTVDDLTITEGAAEIAVDKAFKIRLFNGAFYYSPFVPRVYYLKTYDVDGDFATATDWTLDAQKTLTCNAAPTIQNGTFYCTAPEV